MNCRRPRRVCLNVDSPLRTQWVDKTSESLVIKMFRLCLNLQTRILKHPALKYLIDLSPAVLAFLHTLA